MGEFGASDSTWKKMVLSKCNNEWNSTLKSDEQLENSVTNTTGFELEVTPLKIIKRENEEETDCQSYENIYENDEPEGMVQEIDPLFVASTTQRRRRGSGPKAESNEERSARLAKMSAYAAQRLANETTEQRALRLKRMSEYAAKRLSQESSEQRAQRLARMSAYAARRLARETPEQRQARLTRMSAYAAKRQAMKKMGSSTSSHS